MSTLRVNTLTSIDGGYSIDVKDIPRAPGPGGSLSAGNNLSDLGDRATGFQNLSYKGTGSTTVARSARDKANDVVSVKDYGAIGDNLTDDTAAIQAAFDSGAGQILFPHASYRITGPVTYAGIDRAVINGNGSTLVLDDATGLLDVMIVSTAFGTTVRDLHATRSQVATGGYGFKTVGASGTNFVNCSVPGLHKMFRGFGLFHAIDAWLRGCYVDLTVSHACYQLGTALTGTSTNAHIFDCQFQTCGGDGIRCDDFVIGGSFFRNTIFNNTGWGINLAATTNANTGGDFEVSQNNIDTNAAGGFQSTNYGNVRLGDNWFNGNVKLGALSGQVLVNNNLIYSGAANAIDVAGVDVTVADNIIMSALGAGVLLRTGASVIAINGNVIRGCSTYGIDLLGDPSNVAIGVNQFLANTSGSISTGGVGVSRAALSTGLAVIEATNSKQGVATLVAGAKVVGNTSVTGNSRIFLTSQVDGGTPGFLRVSARTSGTSFTVTSSNGADTSTFAYEIFEPA